MLSPGKSEARDWRRKNLGKSNIQSEAQVGVRSVVSRRPEENIIKHPPTLAAGLSQQRDHAGLQKEKRFLSTSWRNN
jgi:hypothetical protein